MEKHFLDRQTRDGAQLTIEQIAAICPSAVTEVQDENTGEIVRKVNFTTLRQLLGDLSVETPHEAYDFTWVGKTAARREAAMPISQTLRPCPEESVDWDTTKNLYIEGDNLQVLKLLQNYYAGQIKMIYIDPPYNTGQDFVYHDDFHQTIDEYEEAAGVRDELGNRFYVNNDSNGRFHSDWCSMMYTRLVVARTLLSDDGTICVHIDDNEYENLTKICNEVFGEDNFINMITVKTKVGGVSGSSEGKSLRGATEYILMYAKDKSNISFNSVYIKTKLFDRIREYEASGKSWKYTSVVAELSDKVLLKEDEVRGMKFYGYKVLKTESIAAFAKLKGISEEDVYNKYADRIFQTTNAQSSVRQTVIKETAGYDYPMYGLEYAPIKGKNEGNTIEILYKGEQRRMMMFLSDAVEKINDEYYYLDKLTTLWDDIDYNNLTKEGDIEFANGKKPIKLMQRLMKLICNDDSLVMDFFSGSASTAHAVMQENFESQKECRFIMVQLPEETTEDSDAYKAGYKNICEISKERIRRAGKQIKESAGLYAGGLDTGFRVLKIDESDYKEVSFPAKDYSQASLAGLIDNIKEDRSDLDLLFDCMLRWGVELSLPIVRSEADHCHILNVNDGDLVACLAPKETITEAVIDAIAAMHPLRIVLRDTAFEEASQKMNIYELFKQRLGWSDDQASKQIRVI